jgi:hypothetical protein
MNYTTKEELRQSDDNEEEIEIEMKGSKSKTSYNLKTTTSMKLKKDPPEFDQFPQYFLNAENSGNFCYK